MKTNSTINKKGADKEKWKITKWISLYINAMSKALYPPETKGVKSKNDRHITFYK